MAVCMACAKTGLGVRFVVLAFVGWLKCVLKKRNLSARFDLLASAPPGTSLTGGNLARVRLAEIGLRNYLVAMG